MLGRFVLQSIHRFHLPFLPPDPEPPDAFQYTVETGALQAGTPVERVHLLPGATPFRGLQTRTTYSRRCVQRQMAPCRNAHLIE